MFTNIIIVLLIISGVANGNSSDLLWNTKCPCAFAEDTKIGEQLKKEMPDFDSDFSLQLEWKKGEIIPEPNEQLRTEMSLTKKILSEVFKPGIIPEKLTNDKFLLLRDVNFRNGKEDTLVIRFKKEKYIVKIMKSKMVIYITIRPVDGKPIDDIEKLSEEIFTNRILPSKWENSFFYRPNLKRESKVIRAGMWMAKDMWKMDSSGKRYMDTRVAKLSTFIGPIGEGLYHSVGFRTNGKFVMYGITGGPKMQDREYRESSTLEDKETKEN